MRKFLLLGAAALVGSSVALADGEETHNVFGGVYGGWTQMDMPEHSVTPIAFNFGGGLEYPTLQADVDGWSFGTGIGKQLDSGWRVIGTVRFFDGDGAAAGTFVVANATPFRTGNLDGSLISAGAYGGGGNPSNASQKLATNVTEWAGTVTVGRQLFDMVHGDIVVTYTSTDTDNHHTSHIAIGVTPFFEDYRTTTVFSSNAVEVAGRASFDLNLGGGLSAGVGGSAGYAYRHTDMNAAQMSFASVTNTTVTSKLGHKDGDYGFVGRVDGNISFAVTDRTSLAAVGSYVSDSLVPTFVAPDYVVNSPATFKYETQSNTSYGLRLLTRW